MFDVVRGFSSAPGRLRPALLLSLVAHGALLGLALLLSRPEPAPESPVPIRGWPHPHPIGGVTAAPSSASTPPKARRAIRPRTPRAPEKVAPVDSTPPSVEARQAEPGTQETGGGAGAPGQEPGMPECATPPCGGSGPAVYSESIVAEVPALLSAPPIALSAEARRLGVEGTVVARCLITAAGTVEQCELLETVPLAEAAVLAALQGRRYRPARVDGRAVSVRHTFRVRLERAR